MPPSAMSDLACFGLVALAQDACSHAHRACNGAVALTPNTAVCGLVVGHARFHIIKGLQKLTFAQSAAQSEDLDCARAKRSLPLLGHEPDIGVQEVRQGYYRQQHVERNLAI